MSADRENLFEKKMARLQEIIAALESGDLPLEEGMALYREGAECSRFCREQLEKARHELSLWQDGELETLNPDEIGGAARGREPQEAE